MEITMIYFICFIVVTGDVFLIFYLLLHIEATLGIKKSDTRYEPLHA